MVFEDLFDTKWPKSMWDNMSGFWRMQVIGIPLIIVPNNATADFIKKVPGLYTHSMETIYLSLSTQVALGTFFRKFPVAKAWGQCTENLQRNNVVIQSNHRNTNVYLVLL